MPGPFRPTICAVAVMLASPASAQERIAAGTIVVEPVADEVGRLPERQAWAEAAIRALGDAGFTPLPGTGAARYRARITVVRTVSGAALTSGDKAAVAAFPGGVGVGFGGGPRIGGLTRTELTIAVLPYAGGDAVWTGSAITVQADAAREAAADRIAPRLAAAAMSGFPWQRAEAATVP